jgi:hypothetical protein
MVLLIDVAVGVAVQALVRASLAGAPMAAAAQLVD